MRLLAAGRDMSRRRVPSKGINWPFCINVVGWAANRASKVGSRSAVVVIATCTLAYHSEGTCYQPLCVSHGGAVRAHVAMVVRAIANEVRPTASQHVRLIRLYAIQDEQYKYGLLSVEALLSLSPTKSHPPKQVFTLNTQHSRLSTP